MSRGQTAGRCSIRLIADCAVIASILTSILTLCGCSSGPHHRTAFVLTAGCSTRVGAGRRVLERPTTAAVPGSPTAFVGTADGRWGFASLSTRGGGEVAVMALARAAPRLVRLVSLPTSLASGFGMAITPDGRLLLVAGDTATAVLSVRALEDGGHGAVVGVLTDDAAGGFEVAVSSDGRYVFVTDETTGGLSVFDLALALQRGFSASGVVVGFVPLAPGAVGVALSHDGRRLYVSTVGAYGPHGQLWVLNAAAAENGARPAAVLSHVAAAGCQPVRVAVSPDGRTVWVTALQSNALLGFSTARLATDPPQALSADVRVGSEPVGLLIVDDGQLALVGNSNRGLIPGTGSAVPQTVSVVNTAAALDHQRAVIGVIPAGLFPRDMAIDQATGQVLLANFKSRTVEEFPAPAAP